jgi:hypothetical protein
MKRQRFEMFFLSKKPKSSKKQRLLKETSPIKDNKKKNDSDVQKKNLLST